MYANSNASVSTALRRLTRTRHDDLTRDQKYRDDQEQFVTKISHVLEELAHSYERVLHDYDLLLVSIDDEIREHVGDPHPKRSLRLHAYDDIRVNGVYHQRLWLSSIRYKLKKAEYAKPNKVPRMIGDLGTEASLQGFRGFDRFKKCQSKHDYNSDLGTAHFCAQPTQKELRDVFHNLIDPKKKYYFVYFSDDSSISIRVGDVVKTFNMDIKKCDSSHGPGVFRALELATPSNLKPHISLATEQLLKPLSIYSNVHRSRERVLLLPESHVLASGWTGTTVINNIANLMIYLSIERDGAETEEEILRSAAKAGYIVELEECHSYSDIQFLKHSPVYDVDSKLQPLLNLGVLLRTYGACKGDLPGRKNDGMAVRGSLFNLSVIRGMYPRASLSLISALRVACHRDVITSRPELVSKMDQRVHSLTRFKVVEDDSDEYFEVPDEEVVKRYGVSVTEYRHFLELCQSLSFGYHLHSPVGERILQKDYGLSCADDTAPRVSADPI